MHLIRRAPSPPVHFVSIAAVLLAVGCGGGTEPQRVEDVAVEPELLGVGIDDTDTLEATPLDENGNPLPDRASRVEWSISNQSVATLESLEDGRAVVTGVSLGQATARAELGNGVGEARISVVPVALADIEIAASINGGRGEIRSDGTIVLEPTTLRASARLEAILIANDGTRIAPNDFQIRWEVGDSDVATIFNASDPITAVVSQGPGRTEVTLTVGGLQEDRDVIVR